MEWIHFHYYQNQIQNKPLHFLNKIMWGSVNPLAPTDQEIPYLLVGYFCFYEHSKYREKKGENNFMEHCR